MSALLTVSIIGLWVAAVYEPAIVFLSRQASMAPSDAAKMAAYGTGLLSIGAIVNFGLTGAVAAIGTLGTPIALAAIAFAVGLLIIPLATETRGEVWPE